MMTSNVFIGLFGSNVCHYHWKRKTICFIRLVCKSCCCMMGKYYRQVSTRSGWSCQSGNQGDAINSNTVYVEKHSIFTPSSSLHLQYSWKPTTVSCWKLTKENFKYPLLFQFIMLLSDDGKYEQDKKLILREFALKVIISRFIL